MNNSRHPTVSKRFVSYLVAVLMVPALLSACIDPKTNQIDLTGLERLCEFAAAQDGEDVECDMSGSNGVEGNGQGSDPNSSVGPADTGAPIRPPLPDGGTTIQSEHYDNGWNTEVKEYGPLEADLDNVVDKIEDFYAEAGLQVEVSPEYDTPNGRNVDVIARYPENLGDARSVLGLCTVNEQSGSTTVTMQYPSDGADVFSNDQ